MALKTGTEYLRGLRYKLRPMGFPVTKPVYIYGDNQSVLSNAKGPDSQSKKKSNSVAYRHCRESVALDEWRTCYLNTHENIANIMTKTLPAGEKRNKFSAALFHFWNLEYEPRSKPSSTPSGCDGDDKATVSVFTLLNRKGWITRWNKATLYLPDVIWLSCCPSTDDPRPGPFRATLAFEESTTYFLFDFSIGRFVFCRKCDLWKWSSSDSGVVVILIHFFILFWILVRAKISDGPHMSNGRQPCAKTDTTLTGVF